MKDDSCCRPTETRLEVRPSAEPPTQASLHVGEDRFTDFVLRQLEPREQAMARAHVNDVAVALAAGSIERARAWAATRAAEEDALTRLYTARREALVRDNGLSKAMLRAVRELDNLASSAHRRAMDWLAVLERLSQPRTATIRIGAAHQVAIIAGDSEER